MVTITFDRPERMNAIGPVMAGELTDAWTRFRDDDSARVGVLTGRGSEAFCAGGDLKDAFAGNSVVPLSAEEQAAHARGERPGILGPSRWTDVGRTTIAACQRACIRRRPRVGVLDRHRDRRRARHVQSDLPALEHRPRRRGNPATPTDRRLPPRDGADHRRARDRCRRGARNRPGK